MTTELWKYIEAWQARQRFRVSQAALARELKVQPTALSQWKLGKARPTPDNLRALSSVTGVSYEILLNALLIDIGYRDKENADASQERQTQAPPMNQAAGSAAHGDNVVDLPSAAYPLKGSQSAGRAARHEQDEQGES